MNCDMQLLKRVIFDNAPPLLMDLLGLFNRYIYCGMAYRCPICLSDLKSFIPLPHEFTITLYMHGQRFTAFDFETLNVVNYLCPVCRCSDRDRLYALFIKKIPEKVQKDKTLLHFAPERALSFYIRKNTKYFYKTADLYRKDVDDRVDITTMDNYETESVDCFFCSHVLEHVQEATLAIRELYPDSQIIGMGDSHGPNNIGSCPNI